MDRAGILPVRRVAIEPIGEGAHRLSLGVAGDGARGRSATHQDGASGMGDRREAGAVRVGLGEGRVGRGVLIDVAHRFVPSPARGVGVEGVSVAGEESEARIVRAVRRDGGPDDARRGTHEGATKARLARFIGPF